MTRGGRNYSYIGREISSQRACWFWGLDNSVVLLIGRIALSVEVSRIFTTCDTVLLSHDKFSMVQRSSLFVLGFSIQAT
jgi:hypothetical protein